MSQTAIMAATGIDGCRPIDGAVTIQIGTSIASEDVWRYTAANVEQLIEHFGL
jgi:hypothetical protein